MAARKKTASSKKRKVVARGSIASKRKAAPKAAKRMKKAKSAGRQVEMKKSGGSISVGRKPFSKSQFISEIAEQTGLSRKEVVAVMDAQFKIISAHLQKNGPEIFSWPGLFKIKVIKKPATKAREGINPFTGEKMMFKAKPASRRAKILALKGLKEIVGK